MALRIETLATLKTELLNRREALAQNLRQATAELIDDELNTTDSVDQASQDTDKGLTVQIKNRGRDTLIEIDEALRRIEAGIFGECESCGDAISEARMRVNPATTLCIDCKAELESRQLKYPGRAV